jgi:hypothetical protein
MATFLEVGAARSAGLTIGLVLVIARFGYRRIKSRRQSEDLFKESGPDVPRPRDSPDPFGDPK